MKKKTEYTLIDHTADYGFTLCAESPEELFANAALALTDLMLGDSPVEPRLKHRIKVEGEDRTDLMVNWLREILFLFAGEGEAFSHAEVETAEESFLCATVYTEAYDPEKHEILEEIKAVTYHQARVEQTDGGWECQVICDV
ncbi:archease [Desulfatibacillum aliphaticivorans]|uniref:archease n=1 Tax=Desulfatibacillum aliphaticivorans TaxID=218208 RepID=UPI000425447C|nr:archease [Desulfatibacillum aliphaticivorans]